MSGREPLGTGATTNEHEDSDAWLVTIDLPFLRYALRRRRLLLLVVAALGGLVGLAAMSMLDAGSRAQVTILLVPDQAQQPTDSSTDIGLLDTRALAEQVIADRALSMSADEFLSSVQVEGGSGQLLSLVVAAPTDQEAVERADALARVFLRYRASVLTEQADALASGYESEISDLEERSLALTAEITRLTNAGQTGDGSVNDLLAERASVTGKATDLQAAIDSDRIRLAAVLDASKVVDPAAPLESGSLRSMVVAVAGGAFAALALAALLVITLAVFDDRPRRRADIARATGAPVLFSVGPLRQWPWSSRPARHLVASRLHTRVGEGVAAGSTLAFLGVASERETVAVATAVITKLAAADTPVLGVDLTRHRRLAPSLGLPPTALEDWDDVQPSHDDHDSPARVHVIQPDPADAASWRATARMRQPDSRGEQDDLDREGTERRGRRRRARYALDPATVVVGEVDPALGADVFAGWADEAILVLRAGSQNTQRLRTAARQVRASGLRLMGSVLTGSDTFDETLGDTPRPDDASVTVSEGVA